MLIDFDILEKLGSTRQRIKQVFTSVAGTPEYEHRTRWQRKLESRIQEGAVWGLENYQFYYAADLAMDTNIITKEIVPLSLYAQNKISLKDAAISLKQLSPETLAKFATLDEKGEVTGICFPDFHKVVVSLVRSFVTRRVAALSQRYVKQTPFYKYEPMSTSYPAQLKGDALSQRVEMITNAYGYRHDLVQTIRDMLKYSETLEFASCAWEKDETLRKKVRAEGLSDSKNFEVESVITREGIPYKRVHPTRRFYDMAYPLSSINTDTGCSYVAHWNLVPYRTVSDNPAYYNRGRIQFDTSFAGKLVGYRNYFELYSPSAPVNFPQAGTGIDTVSNNDRDKQAGVYSSDGDKQGDTSIVLTEYFERVVPKDCGLGDYPHPVWVRLVVAADNTVVFGEFMPYTPAVYYGYNADDGKIKNMSFAMDAVAFQDQATNILTGYLACQKASLIKIISLDIDQIADAKHVKYIRSQFEGGSYTTTPIVVEHKGSQSAEMGMDRKKIVEISQTDALLDPTKHFSSLIQIISLAERLLGISANEQGRSEEREISATENSNIASTTNTSLAFMGQGIDEGVAAKKKALYQGLMSKSKAKIRLPVIGRYTEATVHSAGFAIEPGSETTPAVDVARNLTILGDVSALEYDYIFTNRDGSERPSNAKSAEVLTLLFQQFAQVPGFLPTTPGAPSMITPAELRDYLNAVLRLSGAPIDFSFREADGALVIPGAAGAPTVVPATSPVTTGPATPVDNLQGFLTAQSPSSQ